MNKQDVVKTNQYTDPGIQNIQFRYNLRQFSSRHTLKHTFNKKMKLMHTCSHSSSFLHNNKLCRLDQLRQTQNMRTWRESLIIRSYGKLKTYFATFNNEYGETINSKALTFWEKVVLAKWLNICYLRVNNNCVTHDKIMAITLIRNSL